jgi:hypothetical protein
MHDNRLKMQTCRGLAAYLFQTIAAEEWQRQKKRGNMQEFRRKQVLFSARRLKIYFWIERVLPPTPATTPHSNAP